MRGSPDGKSQSCIAHFKLFVSSPRARDDPVCSWEKWKWALAQAMHAAAESDSPFLRCDRYHPQNGQSWVALQARVRLSASQGKPCAPVVLCISPINWLNHCYQTMEILLRLLWPLWTVFSHLKNSVVDQGMHVAEGMDFPSEVSSVMLKRVGCMARSKQKKLLRDIWIKRWWQVLIDVQLFPGSKL